MKTTIAFLFSICLLITNSFAQNFWKGSITGEGPMIEKELTLDQFSGIRNGYSCDVYITQGQTQKVVLEGQQNILDNLNLEVSGGVLKIKYDKMVRRAETVKIYITMKTLTEASLSGSGSLVTTDRFQNLSNLKVSVSGSGNMDLDVNARDIEIGISGSGDIALQGSAEDLDVTISGSGGVDARDLAASGCSVSISGSGNATVFARDEIDARVSGSGNIRYKGDVAKVFSRVSGSGKIRSFD